MSRKNETLIISAADLASYEATGVLSADVEPSAALIERVEAENGRATSFTSSPRDVLIAAADAEDELSNAGIRKKDRIGATARHSGAGPTAKSYKYAVKATAVTLLRRSTGWHLTSVNSISVYPKQAESLKVTISEAQAEIVRKAALRPFIVASPQPAPVSAQSA